MVIVSRAFTFNAGAFGRRVGGNTPYAGTWMNAVDVMLYVVLVTVYGTARASSVKSTLMVVDLSPPLTCAWSVAESSTATCSSSALPEGFAIHCETSTSMDFLSIVAEDGTR